MAWRDTLRPASFRGVAFQVDSQDGEVGRRTVVHAYPKRDSVHIEDLGKLPRTFSFDGFLIGPNYHLERNRLNAALEVAGPGTLVHPLWGEFQVTLSQPAKVRESTAEGGLARYSLTFVEAVASKQPVAIPDTAARVTTAAGLSHTALAAAAVPRPLAAAPAAVAEFEAGFDVTDTVEHVRDSARATIQEAVTVLRQSRRRLSSALGVVDDVSLAIDAFEAEVDALLLEPRELAAAVFALVGKVTSIVSVSVLSNAELTTAGATKRVDDDTHVKLLVGVLRDAETVETEAPLVPETTPQREPEAANRAALVLLVEVATTIHICAGAVAIPFPSADQATDVRTRLDEKLEELAGRVVDDATYAALTDLRHAIVDHLIDAAEELPRVTTYTPTITRPSLALAWELYGDATRADELVRRNGLSHPGFVPAGVALEVLSDG